MPVCFQRQEGKVVDWMRGESGGIWRRIRRWGRVIRTHCRKQYIFNQIKKEKALLNVF